MDKKMKKPYESPSTKCTLVEMEAGLCAASMAVTNPNNTNGRITEHSVNTDFGENGTFSAGSSWNVDPNNPSAE